MDKLLLVVIIPLLIPWISKLIWPREITWKELAACACISAFVGLLVAGCGYYRDTADVEIINGQITGKERVTVRCSHSYDCNCYYTYSHHTDSKGRTHTSRHKHCSTCYEHRNDYDWMLNTTLGNIEIDRVDRQGVDEPQRFTQALLYDAVAETHGYTNYVKAAPDSLFHALDLHNFDQLIPPYPSRIYDYHRIDRVVTAGKVAVPDLKTWNNQLSLSLREVGPKKQANVVIVLAGVESMMFSNALEAKWLGGKKNDVVVVLGVPKYPTISWVKVISWTDSQIFKVELRDALMGLGTAKSDTVVTTISTQIAKNYVRKPMKDFKYLEDAIEPPMWILILAFLFSTATSAFLTWKAYNEDFFGDQT